MNIESRKGRKVLSDVFHVCVLCCLGCSGSHGAPADAGNESPPEVDGGVDAGGLDGGLEEDCEVPVCGSSDIEHGVVVHDAVFGAAWSERHGLELPTAAIRVQGRVFPVAEESVYLHLGDATGRRISPHHVDASCDVDQTYHFWLYDERAGGRVESGTELIANLNAYLGATQCLRGGVFYPIGVFAPAD